VRIAAITDIHGNLPALEAVLADIARTGADLIVQTGDALSGPLWPAETADLLASLNFPCVRGNHDREMLGDPLRQWPSDRFARERISQAHLEWLASWPVQCRPAPGVLLFHGTPADDDTYLLEDPASGYAQFRPVAAIEAMLAGIPEKLMICGHTHIPRVVHLADGRTIVNAGSVGLQAYSDNTGGAHRHENGSPHARYARIELQGDTVTAAIVAVPYDWDAAARRASEAQHFDWAHWLQTGRA
jgi:predicted phosphodiesterase